MLNENLKKVRLLILVATNWNLTPRESNLMYQFWNFRLCYLCHFSLRSTTRLRTIGRRIWRVVEQGEKYISINCICLRSQMLHCVQHDRDSMKKNKKTRYIKLDTLLHSSLSCNFKQYFSTYSAKFFTLHSSFLNKFSTFAADLVSPMGYVGQKTSMEHAPCMAALEEVSSLQRVTFGA